jgi:hypothetical protein
MGWIIQHHGFKSAFGTAAALSALALPYFLTADRILHGKGANPKSPIADPQSPIKDQ